MLVTPELLLRQTSHPYVETMVITASACDGRDPSRRVRHSDIDAAIPYHSKIRGCGANGENLPFRANSTR